MITPVSSVFCTFSFPVATCYHLATNGRKPHGFAHTAKKPLMAKSSMNVSLNFPLPTPP